MDVDGILLGVCGLMVLAVWGLLGIGLIQLRLNKGHAAVKESERERYS
jgi:hypothetical protein